MSVPYKTYKVFNIEDFPEDIREGFWKWRGDYNRTVLKFTVESPMVGEYGYKFMNTLTSLLLTEGIEDFDTVIIYSD